VKIIRKKREKNKIKIKRTSKKYIFSQPKDLKKIQKQQKSKKISLFLGSFCKKFTVS